MERKEENVEDEGIEGALYLEFNVLRDFRCPPFAKPAFFR